MGSLFDVSRAVCISPLRSMCVAVLGMTLAACAGGAPPRLAPAPAPVSRIDTFRVAMRPLSRVERTIRVYLPAGYDESDARYPVLYLQDAQNLFTPGLYGDWQVDETLDRLIADERMRGLIVVGIDNGERRWDEYNPWVNTRMLDWVDASWSRAQEGGWGAAYVDFVANTLKPLVDARYRTRPESEHTGIGGSSMGAIVSLYGAITRPARFGRVMAMSPAVMFAEPGGTWLSENQLVTFIQTRAVPNDVRFWIDVGTEERSRDRDPDVVDAQGRPVTYPRAYLEGTQAVVDALRERGVPPENLRHVVDEGAAHNEAAWAKRFEEAVLWLFRNERPRPGQTAP